jgi:mannose-6-phosphate isomerase-like protein (cupin superfamily)
MSEVQTRGDMLVVPPGEGESHWQPVPANGHIEVLFAPDRVEMESKFALGTQSVPPGCYIREHSHPANEEVIYVLSGNGRAVLDGESVAMRPDCAIYLGKSRRHMFINEGTEDLRLLWLLLPNGLENFFRAVGRPRGVDEPTPEPFARPADVQEIERRTVFAAQPMDQRQP